jgi:hypothetical protein
VENDDDITPMTDVLLVGPETEGGGHAVLRRREERLELGELRAVREGQPLAPGEMVRLTKRPEHARLFDVDVLADLRTPAPEGRSGPPQVASDAYRAGWEMIFGDPGDLN